MDALKRPGVVLVIGALLIALIFPVGPASSIALAIVTGGLAVAIAKMWPTAPDWLRAPPERIATALAIFLVVMMGFSTFSQVMSETPDWHKEGDWGPQQAALQHIMSSIPGLDMPVWNQAVGTGDAPLELYPAMTYLITGHVAWLLGLQDNLPLALMIVACLVHISIAAFGTAIASRVAPRPIAIVCGLVLLVDGGNNISQGGVSGLFHWGIFHSATGLAFALIAVLGVLAALKTPRLGASIAIWIGTALATATHPAALLGVAACALALVGVALLARDIPPRRAIAAIGHIALGCALSASVWMPLSARILMYGQHYPNLPRTAGMLLSNLLTQPMPTTYFPIVTFAGYFGMLAGLWSRRAAIVFLSATSIILLVGISDLPYLALGIAPGEGFARLGVDRLGGIARPFVMACSAYGFAVIWRHVRRAWTGATPRARVIAAAVIGVLSGPMLRQVPTLWHSSTARAVGEAQLWAPDPQGRAELETWAKARADEIRPDAYARAMFEDRGHEHMRLTAETGLPSFHMIWLPDLLLRERIEDQSAASLARFDVKWDIAYGESPPFGDPATEKTFGGWHVREIPQWDGKFARIERGSGVVNVTRLDDREVDVEVIATAPVLVALGTGYYPRWRATHASGADEPVYALPTVPGGKLHVVSAWLAPGKTVFTIDGALPSDHDGRFLSWIAALLALAGVVVWFRPRWRVRLLRRAARGLRFVRGKLRWRYTMTSAVGVVLLALFVRGCIGTRSTAAVELGTGLRSGGTVESRSAGGDWQPCTYKLLFGEYACDGGRITVTDDVASLINDADPSWDFVTPSITAQISGGTSAPTLRITRNLPLSGRYWFAMSKNSRGTLTIDDKPVPISDRTSVIQLDDSSSSRTLKLEVQVASTPWSFSFVREDTVVPDRDFLAPPPTDAPSAIH